MVILSGELLQTLVVKVIRSTTFLNKSRGLAAENEVQTTCLATVYRGSGSLRKCARLHIRCINVGRCSERG